MTSLTNNNSNTNSSGEDNRIVGYPDIIINQKNKKLTLKNFGEKVASLNAFFSEYLKGYNIPVAYLKKTEKKSIQFLNVADFRFRVKILNAADSRTARIFSIKPGTALELPVLEYHFGDSKDSVITESHLISFNFCSYDELKMINRLCSKINAIIKSFFERRNLLLLELTCRFGKFDGKIFLIDDFSPMSIKLISSKSEDNLPDPYKIETSAQLKKYSDFLLKLTSGD
jgi:phosphoribosylaminoimidazole-succinocarboxamide synthase